MSSLSSRDDRPSVHSLEGVETRDGWVPRCSACSHLRAGVSGPLSESFSNPTEPRSEQLVRDLCRETPLSFTKRKAKCSGVSCVPLKDMLKFSLPLPVNGPYLETGSLQMSST